MYRKCSKRTIGERKNCKNIVGPALRLRRSSPVHGWYARPQLTKRLLINAIAPFLSSAPRKRGRVHHVRILLCAGAAVCARPAIAADTLKFGASPGWVHPQVIPSGKPSDAPIALLLKDEQVRFDRGKTTTYSEGAVKFQNAQGLADGNVILMWQPATDTVTVNKLQIRRGDKVIDVLAGGQTFTILRRETNLDAATLDGTLTATLQPEGLQVGDIIDLATTTEHSDPGAQGPCRGDVRRLGRLADPGSTRSAELADETCTFSCGKRPIFRRCKKRRPAERPRSK